MCLSIKFCDYLQRVLKQFLENLGCPVVHFYLIYIWAVSNTFFIKVLLELFADAKSMLAEKIICHKIKTRCTSFNGHLLVQFVSPLSQLSCCQACNWVSNSKEYFFRLAQQGNCYPLTYRREWLDPIVLVTKRLKILS